MSDAEKAHAVTDNIEGGLPAAGLGEWRLRHTSTGQDPVVNGGAGFVVG